MATGIFGDVQDSPFQSLARQRTRRIFGVEVPDRALAGVAGGLQGYDPQGGFFGNFARGLSGSLQGGMGFDQLARQRQMEDTKLQMDVEENARQQANSDRYYEIAKQQEARLGRPEPTPPSPLEAYGAFPPDSIGPLPPGGSRAPAGLPYQTGILGEFYKTKAREQAQSMFAKPDAAKPDLPNLSHLNTISDNFRQDKDVQNFTVVRDNARRIEKALDQNSGYGDLSAIFAFMRTLDPESVVRETEFKNAEQAVGYLQRAYNIPGKLAQGTRLTPEGRNVLRRMTRELFGAQKRTYDRKAGMFRRQAQLYGVDPTLVIPDYDDGDDVNGQADLIYNPQTGELEPAQ